MSTSASLVGQVTDASFAADVLESDVPVLVDFTATWCPPCRVLAPVLDELAAERDDVRIVKLDIDDNQQTAARYNVLAAPTLILFRAGQPVTMLVGARPKRRLSGELDAVL